MEQVTSHVLMVRPSAFGFNTETAENNTFQSKPQESESSNIVLTAKSEFDKFVQILQEEGIDVTIIEDTSVPMKPDAVFPNNWISFHQDGMVVTYPMYSSLRRLERRNDILDNLALQFDIRQRLYFETFEKNEQFLEGTGSLVLDRVYKIAYACISDRTHEALVTKWCEKMSYVPHVFHAVSHGKPVYHTNVMMAIATHIAVVCLECLPDEEEREALKQSLAENREVVEITDHQVQTFAGNMLALKNRQGEELMVMSTKALTSLTEEQVKIIEKHSRIVAAPIDTIEDIGGGSARCMIAEIFLSPK